jgi:SSS family transporter
MGLALIDGIIIGLYFSFAIGVGFYFSRRAGKGISEYFVSGRNLPWWMLGTSMVATTFAADTPLAVTEYVRTEGIWRNWFWWNHALGGVMSIFLFSRLWRRTEVLTDNELIELRYSGRPAAALRAFRAFYFFTLYNFVVMGWVIQAMATILQVTLGVPKQMQWASIGLCICIALVYSTFAGLWGVVVTDLVQFCLAMGGSIILAIYSLNEVGGIGELKERLAQVRGDTEATMSFLPPLNVTTSTFWGSPLFTFLVFVLVMWWASHWADGGGYIIQRMLSAKTESHAFWGTLWFNVANHAIRPWPWIIVALVTIVSFPNVSPDKAKEAYPMAINAFLPAGLKGLMLASLFGAFMSTIDTHLNWGSSYFVNDIYKRFLMRTAPERHYVLVSRLSTIGIMLAAGLVATRIGSITKAWEFLAPMAAGVGPVLILRWFWWRINAYSELSAMLASLIINIPLVIKGVPIQQRFILTLPFSLIVWLSVTIFTRPEPREKLIEFYRRVRPGGLWHPIQRELPCVEKGVLHWGFLLDWVSGVAIIYGVTFGTGKLIFQEYRQGLILLGLAILGAVVISYRLKTKEIQGPY